LRSAGNVPAHRSNGIEVLRFNGDHAFDGNEPMSGLQADDAAAGGRERIDPAVSVPKAMSAIPLATATAEPHDEPPGMRARMKLNGFLGVPK
jgi:hypothetical protein